MTLIDTILYASDLKQSGKLPISLGFEVLHTTLVKNIVLDLMPKRPHGRTFIMKLQIQKQETWSTAVGILLVVISVQIINHTPAFTKVIIDIVYSIMKIQD